MAHHAPSDRPDPARGHVPNRQRVSAIVGTLLSAVNQGSVIVAGHANAVTALRVIVNYAVPYTVASVGYLAPFRERSEGRDRHA